jgi:hypothetical protein
MKYCNICINYLENHTISNLINCDNIFSDRIKKNIEYYENITKKLILKKEFIKCNYQCNKCKKIIINKQNYNLHIKNNICEKIKKKIKCEKCNKIFTDKRSLIYHKSKNVCKNINENKNENNEINLNSINNINNTNNNTNNGINIQTQNNHNNINNNNINNNNINNININLNNTNDIQTVVDMIPFRNVKYNITPEKYLEYAKYPERAIKSFIKDEHFNPNKPERMNILNTNRRDNKVQVLDRDDYDEIRWMIKSKTDINELLYDRGVNHLYVAKNILEANGIFLDARTKQRLNDKINEYENDDKSKKEQIDMISDLTYNYRDIVETNKKINNKLIKN